MGLFDFVEKQEVDALPDFFEGASQSELAIYKLARARFDEIVSQLNDGVFLPKRKRQLVRTQLSVKAGLNCKYIHKSKTLRLYEWIEHANKVLDLIFKRCNGSVSHSKQLSKIKRKDILPYVKDLEDECRKFRELSISTICRELVDNEVMSSRLELIESARRAKQELQEALERVENSEARARRLQDELNDLHGQYSAALLKLSMLNGSEVNLNSVKLVVVDKGMDHKK